MQKEKLSKLGQRGQLSIEGIMGGIIVAIIYLILAALVFPPIATAMTPAIVGCVPSGYGSLALTLIYIAVYIIMPVLILATMTTLSRPKTEYVQ